MELHEALRELVAAHGRAMIEDAAGFRGVLDDVLEEEQATTGEINLLVDAVRFDVLSGVDDLLAGGATPQRAVEEAGARLARERGGDDQDSARWAAAVLGYAVGSVPEAVVLGYRSLRAPGTYRPPAAPPPPTAAPPPPTTAPPAAPAAWAPPVTSPPAAWSPMAPSGGVPVAPYGAVPVPPPPAPRRRSTGRWVLVAVAAVVVLAVGVTAAILLVGGDGDEPSAGGDRSSTSAETSGPAVDADALDERYDALGSAIGAGTSDCEAGNPASGQSEVVDCTLASGTLQLVTWEDQAALTAARDVRIDYRAGTITQIEASGALHTFDPEPGRSSDAAAIYWDNTGALQSALIRGTGGSDFEAVRGLFDAASPRTSIPTGPGNDKLRDFIDINMDVAGCTRGPTYFEDETEEDTCTADVDGIVVSVGRFDSRQALRGQRRYYKGEYDAAPTQGGGGTWRFGEGKAEGAYYAYRDEAGTTATLYWDWNEPQCFCYGLAWSFEGKLKAVEDWWPSDEPTP